MPAARATDPAKPGQATHGVLPAMNIQRWKGFVWLASMAVGGYLTFFVSDFLRRKESMAQAVSGEHIEAVLDSVKKPEEQKTDVVDYGQIQRVFHEMDWTGKEKPKPVAQSGPKEVQQPPGVQVAR